MFNTFLIALGFFVAGTFIGSFSGVLMDKPVKKRSFWTGRSECLSCHHVLRWFELIPILSYFMQHGRCRKCHVKIPISVIYIEVVTGIIWALLGTLMVLHGYTAVAVGVHLVISSMFIMLALLDSNTYTIPDRLSLPMIVIVILMLLATKFFHLSTVLLDLRSAFLGALAGMLFYTLQMMIPALMHVMKKGESAKAVDIILMPFVTPLWLVAKIFLGEERADRIFPSFATIDDQPTWVGGGDLRIGILIGLILGPWHVFWAIGFGYTAGSLLFFILKIFFKKELTVLPVAPLLLVGLCITWLIMI